MNSFDEKGHVNNGHVKNMKRLDQRFHYRLSKFFKIYYPLSSENQKEMRKLVIGGKKKKNNKYHVTGEEKYFKTLQD